MLLTISDFLFLSLTFSRYARMRDSRPWSDRKNNYSGPQFTYPPEKAPPEKLIKWNNEGSPIFEMPAEGGHIEP
uniref:Antimicrobial peptide lumbricin-PG n=1 Tax=Metaphire guillelmi TaxID=437222 RepID=LMBPG_METGU|nr:RecName: Full=Antimicrobial peptide lumbricin-PG; AltName: Full=Lumbricin-PG; Flags: Precursor [Metaphire guillelmi]